MRHKPTPAEAALDAALRDAGYVFTAQKPVLGKIADFYFPGSFLVVEVDGGYHKAPRQLARDARRDALFTQAGYRVLRLTNEMVLTNRPKAVSLIFMRLGKADQKSVVRVRRASKRLVGAAVVTATPNPSP